jgi:hypothetical protein
MEHPVPDFHPELCRTTQKKPGLPAKAGLFAYNFKEYQPRVRERIMKLSKVYSATCHHRYWSDR